MKTLKTLTLAISINVLAFGVALADSNEQTYLQDYSMEVNLTALNDAAIDATVDEYSMELDLPTAEYYASRVISSESHDERTYISDYDIELNVPEAVSFNNVHLTKNAAQ